ncbi:MAG: galactokinase [Candidatus Didemnitutus sp.]|nr:galactokinase [Candidatus Didemnitutus sp.]
MTRDKISFLFEQRFGQTPTAISTAPGRIEIIGNHTDYNGGCVIGAGIDRHVWVAASPAISQNIRLASGPTGPVIEIDPRHEGRFSGPEAWANFPFGAWRSLQDFDLPRPPAFDLLILSDLPEGAGLSSSAALELATALALLHLAGQSGPAPADLAAIGRHAENTYVGVPCGILDQGVSAYARKNHLVHIDCRAPAFSLLPFPPAACFWIFNSMEKHALSDGHYAARNRECQEAAVILGVPWLVDLTDTSLAKGTHLLSGAQSKRARHVVEENARVARAVTALEAHDLVALGQLLTASHLSSQHLFENSTPALDSLVDLLHRQPGVHGARLTGGGFGGAVVALTTDRFGTAQADLVAQQHTAHGHPRPDVISLRTADGARLL